VVIQLGVEHIVHSITDNRSNFRKTCRMLSRKYRIVWQTCVAYTINLMLKSTREFLEHKAVTTGNTLIFVGQNRQR
jgi:hypothetical protein